MAVSLVVIGIVQTFAGSVFSPVCKVLGLRTRLSVSQKLDGEQIHLIRELLVRVLAFVELRRSREGVDQDKGWLRRIVRMGHLVASIDTAQMGHCSPLSALTLFVRFDLSRLVVTTIPSPILDREPLEPPSTSGS